MENTTPRPLQDREETLDVQKIIFKVISRWYWFVICLAITYGFAYYVNNYTTTLYSVTSSLVISEERKTITDQLLSAFDRASARKVIENEMAILKSYKIAQRTIRSLDDFMINYYVIGRVRKSIMYKGAPFRVILDTNAVNQPGVPVYIEYLSPKEYKIGIGSDKKMTVHRFEEPYVDPSFHFTLFLKVPKLAETDYKKYYFVINGLNSLVINYQSKLSIATNDKKGTILNLTCVGESPEMEADYLNKLMDVYIRNGLEEKNQTAINTINFIDEQLGSVVDSLHRAEDKLQHFRENNKILDISTEGKAVMERLENVQTERITAEMQLRYYRYLQEYIEKKKDFREVVAPSVMGIGDPLLNSLVTSLAQFYAERSEMSMSVQQNYSGVARIEARIQNAMESLKENIRQIINTANINLNEINSRQTEIEKSIRQLPVTERKLLTIQRDFKLNDQIYNFLLQRRADAAISKAASVADNKVLDYAQAINSAQISPKPGRNTMIAIVLGLLIPLLIIFLMELFNNQIMEPMDVERITVTPIFANIGHNEEKTEIPVFDNPHAPISESFRGLRTNLQYIVRGNEARVICISSSISGEGKTFCAINLASIIAQSNKKTLLMSLDLRKPQVHRVFNMTNDVGISTFLIGKSSYKDVVRMTNINNLYVATSGPVPPNPAELIETPRMAEFIEKAKEEFDTIILDTPPVAVVTDAILLSRFADAFVYVVRQNYSNKSVVHFVEDLNTKHNIKNLGILINDVKIPNYYGYRYAYGYGYGYYQSYYSEGVRVKQKHSFFSQTKRFLKRWGIIS